MYIGLHVKYPLFLSYFNEPSIFSAALRQILKYQISWKSVQWEPNCSVRTDGQDEANSLFSQFCVAPYISCNIMPSEVSFRPFHRMYSSPSKMRLLLPTRLCGEGLTNHSPNPKIEGLSFLGFPFNKTLQWMALGFSSSPHSFPHWKCWFMKPKPEKICKILLFLETKYMHMVLT